MALAPGLRLGPYEVLSSLGAGGMGEVYRARDTRLTREVAVKVLPAELASSPDRLERFEREARAASSLNHPNIVTIFDIGVQDGTSYIAMERVDGTTLRSFAKGPVAPKKLLEIAAQIAAGLARAHAAGIVHRDLKPENVMVAGNGHVKILDFGLAKVTAAAGPHESNLETAGITESGIVLGTAPYMSPEQVAGSAVDFRSDQFALGAILYELATGQRAFHGKTLVDTLGAVLNDEPTPVARLVPQTPAPLRWIIDRCLAKDPGRRYASTDDLALELANLRDHLSEAAVPEAEAPPATRFRRRIVLGIAGAAAAALVLAFTVVRLRPAPAPSFRPLTFRRGALLQARFAPDGHTVVYGAAFGGDRKDVFVTRLDSLESRPLGLPDSTLLSISRKGSMALAVRTRSVVNSLHGTLAEMPLSTAGAPREILDDVLAADYDPAGEVLAVVRAGGRLELPPGKPFGERMGGELGPPRFSSDGRLVAFATYNLFTREGVPMVADREARARPLAERWNDLGGLAWSPAGTELWISGERPGRPRGIYALPLGGGERLVWRGPGAVRLLDADRSGRVLVAREEHSSILFASGSGAEREMSWLDDSQLAATSDDGRTLLFTDRSSASEPGTSVYIRRLDGSAPVRLSPGRALDLSPDGRFALVQRGSAEEPRLFLVPTGAGEERPLDIAPLHAVDARFFHDGKRLLILGSDPRGAEGPFLRGVQGHFVRDLGSGASHCITPEGAHYRNAISPDGRFTLGMALGKNEGKTFLYPTDPAAGPPREVTGIDWREFPVSFTSDGSGVYVVDYWVPPPWQVTRVDLATGKRTPWKTIAPSDPAGILRLGVLRISPDGAAWAYSAPRQLGTLFLAEGLK